MTTYHYDSSNRLTEVDESNGTTVTFAYDANGHRDQKTVTTGGSNPTTYQVNDTYQNGRLASQSTLGGTLLATFTYDPSGIPESVVVGTDPNNSPRYYYVYNGHGDVVALTDASGNIVASYSYDVWGNLTSASETIPNANGWSNPYRYDGKDGARYDLETGLYWLSTRAYDPTIGRFVQRDPLGRAPLFFADQPYAYAGNNPLVNVDPSGELIWRAEGLTAHQQAQAVRYTQRVMRMIPRHPVHPAVHPQPIIQRPRSSAILNTFHDSRTQGILTLLLYTGLGREFLNFLLAAGQAEGLGADRYIRWDYSGGGAYTDWSGRILMSDSLLSNPLAAVGALVHEAVESFYARADGIRSQASQHMDYVADWFGGEVEIATAYALHMTPPQIGDPGSGAYLQTFQQWETNNGATYATCPGPDCEPVNQPEAQQGGGFWASLIANPGLPDPMGLTEGMLLATDLGSGWPPAQSVVAA